MAIYFHNENIEFNYNDKKRCKKWIKAVIKKYSFRVGDLNIIFSSNSHLLEINQKYLNHNYFTDIITFDYSDKDLVSGDIFISIEKVILNSEVFDQSFNNELRRVIIHGVLHLLGFDDKNKIQLEVMRKMEDEALNLWIETESIK